MLPLRAVALAVCIGVGGCASDGGSTIRSDVSFVETGVDAGTTADVADGGVGRSGCSVIDPSACEGSGQICCDEPTPRCVPGADGQNTCVAAGSGVAGASCSADDDTCSAGLLCASSSRAEIAGLICLRICEPSDSTCPTGSFCREIAEVSGERIGVCD